MTAEYVLAPGGLGADEALGILRGMTSPPGAQMTPAGRTQADPAQEALAEAERLDHQMRELLERIQRRDQSALSAFYDLTVSRVYGLALRITSRRDAAEEVCGDVYMQVWRDASRYETSRGKVLAWLLTICRSRAIDSLRRRDEAEPVADPEQIGSAQRAGENDPQDLLSAAQANGALHQALGQLSALQRQLLSLAFFRGLTHDEIAEHAQLPLGTVKTHIRKALALLRDRLIQA